MTGCSPPATSQEQERAAWQERQERQEEVYYWADVWQVVGGIASDHVIPSLP